MTTYQMQIGVLYGLQCIYAHIYKIPNRVDALAIVAHTACSTLIHINSHDPACHKGAKKTNYSRTVQCKKMQIETVNKWPDCC